VLAGRGVGTAIVPVGTQAPRSLPLPHATTTMPLAGVAGSGPAGAGDGGSLDAPIGGVVRTLEVVAIDAHGDQCGPSHCAKGHVAGTPCVFVPKGWHSPGKQAFTMQGPVALRHRQFLCTVHSSVVSCKVSHRQFFAPTGTLRPDLVQFGQVRWL
jgi:hypothetical protein